MIYVFTLQRNCPLPLLHLAQDLTRQYLINLVLTAKLHSHSHSHSLPKTTTTSGSSASNKSSSSSSTTTTTTPTNHQNTTITVEDVLFQIRTRLGLIERLKVYLSWKDVRKRTKEPNSQLNEDDSDPIAVVAVDEAGGGENEKNSSTSSTSSNTNNNSLKVGRAGNFGNLTWELGDAYHEYLTTTSSASSESNTPILGYEEHQDDHDKELKKALQENRQILKVKFVYSFPPLVLLDRDFVFRKLIAGILQTGSG